jgi:hypothetical protein
MIYIQSTSDKNLPHHFDAACALYGAEDLGLPFRLTSYEEVASGKFDNLIRNNLFVGSTEFMLQVFNRANIDYQRLPNSNRPFETITLGEARLRGKSGNHTFIKPFDIKLFTGFVIDESDYTSIKGLPDDTLVMAYEPFNSPLISEWRVYIHNGEIIDSRNYSGSFMISPDYSYVNQIVKENKFACAYTVDVGILMNAKTVVVEYNDMWAIGNYGMPNDLYVRALKDRYFEIVKPK